MSKNVETPQSRVEELLTDIRDRMSGGGGGLAAGSTFEFVDDSLMAQETLDLIDYASTFMRNNGDFKAVYSIEADNSALFTNILEIVGRGNIPVIAILNDVGIPNYINCYANAGTNTYAIGFTASEYITETRTGLLKMILDIRYSTSTIECTFEPKYPTTTDISTDGAQATEIFYLRTKKGATGTVGYPCHFSANNTMANTASNGRFVGKIVSRDGAVLTVQYRGLVTFPYSGSAPSVGFSMLVADGAGGVKNAQDAHEFLVVNVNTTDRTVTLLL